MKTKAFGVNKYITEVEKDLEKIEIKTVKMGGSFSASGVTWNATINEGLDTEYRINDLLLSISRELHDKLFALRNKEFTGAEFIDMAKKIKF